MKATLITLVMKALVGGTLWANAKRLVTDIQNLEHLSGPEKHARVVEDLRNLASDLGTMLLDTTAQLAAQWLRLQAR